MEEFQYLMWITHYDDENGLIYVTTKVWVGSSPVGPGVLTERVSVLANDLVSV